MTVRRLKTSDSQRDSRPQRMRRAPVFAAARLLLALSLVVCAAPSFAGTYTLLPPQGFERGSGQPVTETVSFSALDPDGVYTIYVFNGGLEDHELTGEKVSASTIMLNGSDVFTPAEFNQNVVSASKAVTLLADNVLSVELRGAPGGVITLLIEGEDDVAPSISASVNPDPNPAGWHRGDVNIDFTCFDATSGIASCTDSLLVTGEGAAQVFTGSAVDNAGNQASVSVTVNLDRSAPTIAALTDSPANAAGWHRAAVEVSFDCQDALSGIDSCSPPVVVATEGAGQLVAGSARDIAGNEAAASLTLNVDFTSPSVQILAPAAGAVLAELRPEILLELGDNLALDADSLALSVNGAAFDGSCVIDSGNAACTPNSDLPAGDILLSASVGDLAANQGSDQVAFRITVDRDGDGVIDAEDAFPDDPTEWADLDGDGIGDNSDPDRDGDGIGNDFEEQLGFDPNDANSTPPDFDGDGIPDVLDADRDGDGVDNDADSFPDDPTRAILPAVTGLQVVQQGQQVAAGWDAHPDPIVTGYHVERRPFGGSSTQILAAAGAVCDVDANGFVDRNDIEAITLARNMPSTGPGDPRDANGDGSIDILDARSCVLQCNLPRCDIAVASLSGGGVWQRLTAAPVSLTEFIDVTAQNGIAYEYRVIAVDARGIESEPSAVASLLFAYNDRSVSQAAIAWSNYKAALSWTLALEANETIRVYRGTVGAGDIAFDGAAQAFTDTASQWSEDQRYQVVSVLSFDNPIGGGVEQREGPAVELLLAALPALEAGIEDAVRTGTGSWQIESPVGVSLGIVGEFDNAAGSVGVSLVYSGGTLNAQVDSGRFQFVVRDVQRETFTINLVEAGAPADRKLTLTLEVIADNTPLTLQLDNPPLANSDAASVAVSGRLLNLDGGLRRLRATSDRFPGLGFGLTLVDDGRFFGDVPLEFGDNQVGVDALAGNGEAASAGILVTRAAPAVPSIQFTSHTPNQVVNQNRINLSGRLYSSLGADEIQLRVGGVDTPVSEVSPGIYAFTRSGVQLAFGFNQLVARAQTPLGSSEAAIAIYFQDSVSDPALPLKLELTTPNNGQIVNDDVLLVRGQLLNATASPAVSVNGVPAALFGSAARGWLFNAAINISARLDGDVVVTVDASASGKAPVQEIVTVSVDRADPQLAVDNPLQAPPAVNEIVDKPFVLTGTVSDSNLAAVTLNGLEVTLSPGSGAGNFTFESSLALPRGVPTAISLLAVDRAGNETSLDFELLSNPGPAIDVIQPLAGAEYVVFNNSQLIETITRVSDAPAGSTLTIEAGSASNQQAVNQEIIASDLSVDADPAIDEIRFTLRDAGGAAIASQAVPITVIDGANIPLKLERTVPAQSDRFREPHHPVQFYFNRPVALADLLVDVRETVHGVSYSSERKSGATLGEMYQGATVEVHKDQEPVAGALSLLPGERIVEFYPDADLSYGARVFVSLSHQGNQLVRFFYDVRSNPTFVKVALNDQAGQPVPGVVVSIPELGFESASGDNGTLVLGTAAPAELEVETRLYRLLVNPGLKNPRYGTRELQLQINGGQVNDLTSLRLPELSPNVPFRLLQSGVSDNLLVGGDLRIDTLNAVLTFADGRDNGQVHVQMANYTDGLYAASDIDLAPLWMFNLQPGPIRVRGQIGLEIRMPTLFGTHDYVPDSGTRVLLMGLDHDTGLVEPIGVGRIEGVDVVSEGVLRATRLDFIGYQFIAAQYQPLAAQYASGEIGLDALKQGILEQ